ncbi:MAG: translation initiation factor IF-2 [Pseudomonadota bacterium]
MNINNDDLTNNKTSDDDADSDSVDLINDSDNVDNKKPTLSLKNTLSLNPSSKKNNSKKFSSVDVVIKKKRSYKKPEQSVDNIPSQKLNSENNVTISSNKNTTNNNDDQYILTNDERESRAKALESAAEIENLLNKQKQESLIEISIQNNDPVEKKSSTTDKIIHSQITETDNTAPQINNINNFDEQNAINSSNNNIENDENNSDDTSSNESNKKKVSTTTYEKEQSNKKKRIKRNEETKRTTGKMLMMKAMDDDSSNEKMHSLASLNRKKAKEKRKNLNTGSDVQTKFKREIIVPESITVQELSNRMFEKSTDVIRSLMKMGMIVQINDKIDTDTAELIIDEFGHTIKRVQESDIEDVVLKIEYGQLSPRAPVVSVMGHVDHGKTSLLDAIRSTDIVSGEDGGITQHIGAYRVRVSDKNKDYITFLDTPGHEAFTSMRLRGAHATDIVVLVVAADDSVKEQTIEAISHAKAAKVPIIVAVNKIDKPNANPTNVMTDLLQHDIVTEAMGGEVMSVEVSATQKLNIDKLIETIQLQAEILELSAPLDGRAQAIVVESKTDKSKGVVTTILVQKGTLNIADIILAGNSIGRVRAMYDEHDRKVKYATPSMPVKILGFDSAPEAGEVLYVVNSEKDAKDVMNYRVKRDRDMKSSMANNSLENLFSKAAGSGVKELAVIIKADVHGSAEAIMNNLQKLNNDEVAVKILHSATGAISESDVTLANASNGIILGFNVRTNSAARQIAEDESVKIRYYSIIYNLVDDMKMVLSDMLEPELQEKHLGNAKIRQIFNMTKYGKVAGCFVTEGIIKRGASVRLIRDGVVIHEGKLKTLRRFKDEVKEVASNYECGMAFENYTDIKENDIIEAFEIIKVSRHIDNIN